MISDGAPSTRERFALLGEIAAEIAHELQNTLQIISSSAFVARQALGSDDADAALSHIAKVERHARAAHAIVDDLMALARDEPLDHETVPVPEVLAAARSDLPRPGADWNDSVDPPDQRIEGHAGLLVRLLRILYENAIQASAPRAPHIETRVRQDDKYLAIEVADDGPGVPADIAGDLFEPLVTARVGGTGLGLSLARRIALAHGGSIVLASDAATGARFRIALPRSTR